MTTTLKIILIIVTFAVCMFLIMLIMDANAGGSIGVLGGIIGFAMIAAITAIWKYEPVKKENDDIHKLDKS